MGLLRKFLAFRKTMGTRTALVQGLQLKGYLKFSEFFPNITKHFNPPLLNVAIEPTNFCNLRCKICRAQNPIIFESRERGFMDWSLFQKVIDELSEFKHHINICLNIGGESMLHPSFADMIHYIGSKDRFPMHYTTNATLLNDEIADAIIEHKVDTVISLDGLKGKHEEIRRGSKYEIVEWNIQRLLEKRGNNKKPSISVNLVISEHAKKDITDFINAWIGIVDWVGINPYETKDFRIKDKTFFDRPTMSQNYCKRMFSYMGILWNGDVVPCCRARPYLNIMGNVKDKTMLQVWKEKAYSNLRLSSLTNNYPKASLCYTCDVWKTSFIPCSEHNNGRLVTYLGYGKNYHATKKT